MVDGMQFSAAGGRLHSARVDLIGMNLSKMTDAGYKADFGTIQARAIRDRGLPVPVDLVSSPDFSSGALVDSGRALDVALVGEGFLRATDGTDIYYTRSGGLHVDAEGQLALACGFKVVDAGGQPITVARDQKVEIDRMGNVLQGSGSVGRLDTVRFSDPSRQLVRRRGHFVATDDTVQTEPAECDIAAGMRESSNVTAVQAMVELIESSRAFEANMRMVKYQDSTLGTLINRVGSVPG